MQRPRSVPTLCLSCLSNTLLWKVRTSPVLLPSLPTSTVVSVSACSMKWIVRVDPPVGLPAKLPPELSPQPQARPTVSVAPPTAAKTLNPFISSSCSARGTGKRRLPRDRGQRRAPWWIRDHPFTAPYTNSITLYPYSELHASQATRASQA